jgi:hypothetical protein
VKVRVFTLLDGENSIDAICEFDVMPRAYDQLVVNGQVWHVVGPPQIFARQAQEPAPPSYAAQVTVLPLLDENQKPMSWHPPA